MKLNRLHFIDRSKNQLISLAVLLVGVVVVLISTYIIGISVENSEKKEYTMICNEIKTKLDVRLQSNAQLLRSASSLFTASESVSRREWNTFSLLNEMDSDVTELLGIGVSVLVKNSQLEKHVAAIRGEGFPAYNVLPKGKRAEYAPIVYLEPYMGENLKSFGHDLLNDSACQRALFLSRDSNSVELSESEAFVQNSISDYSMGYIMFAPIYKDGSQLKTLEQRRKALYGWVFTPFRLRAFMTDILGPWNSDAENSIRLRIFSPQDTTSYLLYDSERYTKEEHMELTSRSLIIPLSFNGHVWHLNFSQLKKDHPFIKGKVLIVLISGLIIVLLIYILTIILLNINLKAHLIAEKLTIKLKESEARYRIIADYSLNWEIFRNSQGDFVYSSPAFESLTGHTNEELQQGRIMLKSIVHPNDWEKTQRVFTQAQQGKFIAGHEFRMNTKNGNLKYVTMSVQPVKTGDDELLGYRASIKDITKQKLAELEITRQNTELHQLSGDKDAFLSILAHDLKGPFSSIIGFIDLLINNYESFEKKEIKKNLEIVDQSARYAFDMLNDILQWARAKSGKMYFEPMRIDLNELCEEVFQTLKLNASEKQIDVRFNIPDQYILFADYQMLKTILRNLISNAIKFTNINGSVTVSAEQTDTATMIKVADTGVGISSQRLNLLFDMTKIHSTTGTSNEKGTGFGLLICKEFVERHSGLLWVESHPGIGTDFQFTIPNKFSTPVK